MTRVQKDTHCVLLRNVRALTSDFEQALHEVCTLFIGRLFLSQLSEFILQRVFMRPVTKEFTCQGDGESNLRSLYSAFCTRLFSSATTF
jgi:hypothetical protein